MSVCGCMCRKSEGPSELIGSEVDKGGPLQKRNPGEMFTQEKGRGVRESKRGFQMWSLFLMVFPS